MATSASRTIKSAHRVLEILEYFDQDRRHATVMDMSRTLSYPQSSTSELLRCLTRLGYLHYNRFRRTYSPTVRVALLGAWVKPSLFRGGPVLSAIDELAQVTNETVLLSTASNYEVQHLHVIHGSDEQSVEVHAGDTCPLLHSTQGRLMLSGYENDNIRSIVHRLNADEADLSRHVRVSDVIAEMAALRERGGIAEEVTGDVGCIAVLLPFRRNMDRFVISVQAKADVIAERGKEILDLLIQRRDMIVALYDDEEHPEPGASNVVQMPAPMKIASYRRHFA